jgi:hypothetical protein
LILSYRQTKRGKNTETTEYFFDEARIEDVSLCLVTDRIDKIADSGTDVKQIFRRQHRATFGHREYGIFVSPDSNLLPMPALPNCHSFSRYLALANHGYK